MDQKFRELQRAAQGGDLDAATQYWRLQTRQGLYREKLKYKDAFILGPEDFESCGVKFPKRVIPGDLEVRLFSDKEVLFGPSTGWGINGIGVTINYLRMWYWTQEEVDKYWSARKTGGWANYEPEPEWWEYNPLSRGSGAFRTSYPGAVTGNPLSESQRKKLIESMTQILEKCVVGFMDAKKINVHNQIVAKEEQIKELYKQVAQKEREIAQLIIKELNI